MRDVLVFGGSGQIGRPVLDALRHRGCRVVAVSRDRHDDADDLRWLRGDLAACEGLPARVDAIVSCGPLDAFAAWFDRTAPDCTRVVAFGSTSVSTKTASGDAGERDVAARLRRAEEQLFARALASGVAATVLRPTLVYGAGRDATLSRIAHIARARGWFPLPRGATGLRQPVHVEDLASAAVACLSHRATAGRAYDVPGGETLAYREMVRRVLGAIEPPARLVELPAPLFALLLRIARARGMAGGLTSDAIERMRCDLVFDAAPAHADFGYAPRPFHPDAYTFPRLD